MMPMLARVLAAVALLSAGALAQQPRVAPLTAADYAEIHQLYASYSYAFDRVADNGAAWANLFSADGVYIDTRGTQVAGRERMLAYIWDKGVSSVSTYVTNVMLTPTRDGASGRAYLMLVDVGEVGSLGTIGAGGIFLDDLVRTPQGWRFRQKRLMSPGAAVHAAPAVAAAPVRPQQPSAGARSVLTAEDYAEIQQLYARYAQGIDHALEDKGEAMINVYTVDGVFVNQTMNRTEGRDRLRTFAAGNSNSGRGRLNIQHLTWNVIIEPAPWGAYGKAYLSTVRRPGQETTIALGEGGIYHDTLVKTAEGWRFKKRQFVKDWPRLARGTPQAPPRPATAR